MKLRFYFRVIGLTFLLFPSWVNKCLVFDGWKLPYITDCNSIRNNMSFKEILI
ncbi:MAG: hypothetical protein ACOVNU_05835 [Candidatus Kapaibacteriota bacterium]